MATFFYDVKVGYWNTVDLRGSLYGDVSRNGNTVTLQNMRFDMYPSASAWGTSSFTLQVNGTSTTWTATDGRLNNAVVNDTSISVSASQTSAQIGWSTSDGESGSFTITFPSGATVPTGLSISNIIPMTTGVTATVSVTSWGEGGTDPSAYYRELCIFPYGQFEQDPSRKNRTMGATLSSAITTDNNSQWLGTLTIQPNTKYVLGIYATNNNSPAHGQTNAGTYVTLAEAPTVSLDSVTASSATISYATSADGGEYSKTLEYSLDGTTWSTGATVSSGSATSGTYTITGLSGGTTYSIQTRVTTTAGSSTGATVSATTTGSTNKLYGSVNGQTKRVTKLYGSVNGQTKKILKLYGSVNSVTKLIYQD